MTDCALAPPLSAYAEGGVNHYRRVATFLEFFFAPFAFCAANSPNPIFPSVNSVRSVVNLLLLNPVQPARVIIQNFFLYRIGDFLIGAEIWASSRARLLRDASFQARR